MGCRDISKGESAKKLIIDSNSSINPKLIKVFPLDLSSFDNVIRFAMTFKECMNYIILIILIFNLYHI